MTMTAASAAAPASSGSIDAPALSFAKYLTSTRHDIGDDLRSATDAQSDLRDQLALSRDEAALARQACAGTYDITDASVGDLRAQLRQVAAEIEAFGRARTAEQVRSEQLMSVLGARVEEQHGELERLKREYRQQFLDSKNQLIDTQACVQALSGEVKAAKVTGEAAQAQALENFEKIDGIVGQLQRAMRQSGSETEQMAGSVREELTSVASQLSELEGESAQFDRQFWLNVGEIERQIVLTDEAVGAR